MNIGRRKIEIRGHLRGLGEIGNGHSKKVEIDLMHTLEL